MKKYDTKLRKWVDSGSLDKHMSERDPKVCRGKKPHDYVLVLPEHAHYDSTYNFKAEEYYALCDKMFDMIEAHKSELKSLGIRDQQRWNRKETRLFICSVCKKRKYVFPE